MSTSFAPGQRVVAPAEPQLGLGVVTEATGRRFQVLFGKADVHRTYSSDSTAVIRFQAKPGDRLSTVEGQDFVVAGIVELDGLLAYTSKEGEQIPEIRLSMDLRHSDPLSLLAVGKPGSPSTFGSRSASYHLRALGRSQAYRGLGSARVELLSHQLFVAERVSGMWRPRVLLADEVGLGKTIEAGLIGVRLAALGRADSVAVVAPRALVGQWLAEFYRRFARPLTLFDAELEELPQDVLVAADDLEFLPEGFERELLIVDEAHHYYQDESLGELAQRCEAVLFLTATPSLGGTDSLFRLLNQLDALRYPDAKSLQSKGESWTEVADLARQIESGLEAKKLSALLKKAFPEEKDLLDLVKSDSREELLQRLVDRHGLGRSLIRNRRARMQGLFSPRVVKEHDLGEQKLDDFLIDTLRGLSAEGKKALVMVESTKEVSRWARLLGRKTKLSVARFDETMSLLERDRQAAWFNRTRLIKGEEDPASVLICSELGGEGRNFQVAHHLILLDLPQHPDKLEQRIGRLDRIGQTEQVTVHVPLPKKDKARRVRFRWLHDGLDAFTKPLAEGQTAFQKFGDLLQEIETKGLKDKRFPQFLDEVKKFAEKAKAEAEQSVDPLIDRMSFDEEKAEQLKSRVQSEQEELSDELQARLPDLLDSVGVILEARGEEGLYHVRAGDMMFVEALPGLPPGGTWATFDRETANRRDDVEFLHFEHRLVQGALDVILDEGVGKATAARWRGAPKTTVLFQFFFVLEAEGPERLGLSRFLPTKTVILGGDMAGLVERGTQLPGTQDEVPDGMLEKLAPEVVETLLARTGDLRPKLVDKAQAILQDDLDELREQALAKAGQYFERERARVDSLQGQAEDEELIELQRSLLKTQGQETLTCLNKAQWRFDAVRLILCQE